MFLPFGTDGWKLTLSNLFGDAAEQKKLPNHYPPNTGFLAKWFTSDLGTSERGGREALDLDGSVSSFIK